MRNKYIIITVITIIWRVLFTLCTRWNVLEGAAQDNPNERLEDITHLAGLCIEVLQQNEEHHADVSSFSAF